MDEMRIESKFTRGIASRLIKKAMDDLMCETLEKFGCHEGVKIFREAPKYYS